MDNFNIVSLEKANASLISAWRKYNQNTEDDFVRDSVIQRFEYTYALAIKYIQRYLELNNPNPQDIDFYTFNDLIRTANEKGILLNDLGKWSVYRQRRNITSHTYNVEKALLVLEIINDFIEDINYLLNKIK